jgi:hypothetical protein
MGMCKNGISSVFYLGIIFRVDTNPFSVDSKQKLIIDDAVIVDKIDARLIVRNQFVDVLNDLNTEIRRVLYFPAISQVGKYSFPFDALPTHL